MNALSENSLSDMSPETIQTFHDLALLWVKENIKVTGLSPEELYSDYRKCYDKMVDADLAGQKEPSTNSW